MFCADERKQMHKDKIEYETPQIKDHGDLAELTAGNHEGEFTDAAFPQHTPKNLLTFSGP
jgi:hypothetical protein